MNPSPPVAADPAQGPAEMSLFPLQAVLFPGGLLALKVFEARYLDLVGECLRENKPFGVVCLLQGSELRQDNAGVRFESKGVLAAIEEVDADQPGLLHLRCRGGQRFEWVDARQDADGLWRAHARLLDDDVVQAPDPTLLPAVRALSAAIATLDEQGAHPFAQPFRLNDAGWVANRWCEILPISLAAKQKLMALADPQVRLQLVDEFLRSKGVIAG